MRVYAGVTLKTVTDDDMVDLHEYFRNIFAGYGLSGDELDAAMAGCIRPAVAAIEAHREARPQLVVNNVTA